MSQVDKDTLLVNVDYMIVWPFDVCLLRKYIVKFPASWSFFQDIYLDNPKTHWKECEYSRLGFFRWFKPPTKNQRIL